MHRADNLTDPLLRQQHPISTISGWHDASQNIPNGCHPDNERWQNSRACLQEIELNENDKSEQVCSCDYNSTLSEGSPVSYVAKHEDSEVVSLDSRTSDLFSDGKISKESPYSQDSPLKSHLIEDNMDPNLDSLICNGIHMESSPSFGSPVNVSDHKNEIIEEIVQEILSKSEKLLEEHVDICSDSNSRTTSPIVVEDQEIAQAIQEVANNVPDVEKVSAVETKIAESIAEPLELSNHEESNHIDDEIPPPQPTGVISPEKEVVFSDKAVSSPEKEVPDSESERYKVHFINLLLIRFL